MVNTKFSTVVPGKVEVKGGYNWRGAHNRLQIYWSILFLRLGREHMSICQITVHTFYVYHIYFLWMKYFIIQIVFLNDSSGC